MAVGRFELPITAGTTTPGEPVEWVRPADWPEIATVGDNEINLLVHDQGLAVAFACTIASSGTYSIDWGDGTVETGRASTTVYQHSYTAGTGTACTEGYTTFKVRIYGASGNITKFTVELHNLSSGGQYQPILEAVFGTNNLTTLANAFHNSGGNGSYCKDLRHVTLPVFTNVASTSYCFNECNALLSVDMPTSWGAVTNVSRMFYNWYALGSLSLPTSWGSITDASYMLSGCFTLSDFTLPTSWGSVTNLTNFLNGNRVITSIALPSSWGSVATLTNMFGTCNGLISLTLPTSWGSVTGIGNMFYSCNNLRSLALPASFGNITSAGAAFAYCQSLTTVTNAEYLGSAVSACDMNSLLQSTEMLTSLSIGSLLSKIGVMGTSSVKNKLSSLRLTNASSTFGGSSPQVDVSYTSLDATALNTLFGDLPTVTGKTIKITGATGAATCTQSIATGKGWTVTN